ncbi:MAG: SPOR domain-containing protein [Thermodesulfobacteriota bacterium]
MQYCPQCGSDNVLVSTRRTAWRNLMRSLGFRYFICDECYTRFRARLGQDGRPPQVTPPPVEPEPLPTPPPPPAAAPDFSLEPAPDIMLEPRPRPEFAEGQEPAWDRSPRQPDLDFPPPQDQDEPETKPSALPWLSAGLLAKVCAGLAVVLGVAALFYWYRLSLAPPPPASQPVAARIKIAPEPLTPPAPPAPVEPITPAAPAALSPTGGGQPGLASQPTLATLPSPPPTSLTATTLAPPPPPPPPPPAPASAPVPTPAAKIPAAPAAAKPAAKPAPPAPAKAGAVKAALALQFGAFSEPARAKALADKLKRAGLKVHLVPSDGENDRKLTKVRYGAFANLDQARQAQKEVKAKTGLETVIVKNGR